MFHVTWGDPGANYLQVESMSEMDSTLDAIAEKSAGPVVVFIDYEVTQPARQLRVLIGHPTRSSVRWTSYGASPEQFVALDPKMPSWDGGELACDIEGIRGTLPIEDTCVSPTYARRAALEFVACVGARPKNVPWRVQVDEAGSPASE